MDNWKLQMRINFLNANGLILTLQVLLSILFPLYDSFLKNMISDMSSLVIVIIGIRHSILSYFDKVDEFEYYLLIMSYIQKCLMNHILMNGICVSYVVVTQLSVLHVLPRILFTYEQHIYLPVLKGGLAVLGLMTLQILYKYKVSSSQEPGLSSLAELQLYLQIISIIMYYWLEFHFNSRRLDNNLSKLVFENEQLKQSIEDNEVHGAQLVHELRNPLNSMMGSITLLEKILPVKNQQVSEVLSVAKCCGEHLHTLIGNLLEFSKLKKKKVELNKGQVDLKSNVRKIVKMNYFKAKEKSNRLNLYVSRNFPKKVIADEQRINQILINLISNAIKFTDKGSIGVYLGWRPTNQISIDNKDQSDDKDLIARQECEIQYTEEKYLFKNFGEKISDDSQADHTSNSSISKMESNNRSFYENQCHRNSEYIKDRKSHILAKKKIMLRSQSDNQNELFQSSNNRMQFIRNTDLEQAQLSQNNKSEVPQKHQIIEMNNLTSLQFSNTTTFFFDKGQNTTFQFQQDSCTNMANCSLENNAQSKADELLGLQQQPPFRESNKFKDLDDYLLGDQVQEEKEEDVQYPNMNHKDSNREMDPNDFQNDLDVMLLQDENVSARENFGLNVRESINAKSVMMGDQNQERLGINYGTPPDRKGGQNISDQEKRVIERVVKQHKSAQSNFLMNFSFLHSNSDDLIITHRGDGQHSNRGNLHQQKKIMDESHNFSAKFLRTREFQYVSNHSEDDQNEERKTVTIRSFRSNKIDDNELLKKSIVTVKKHYPQKKESYDRLLYGYLQIQSQQQSNNSQQQNLEPSTFADAAKQEIERKASQNSVNHMESQHDNTDYKQKKGNVVLLGQIGRDGNDQFHFSFQLNQKKNPDNHLLNDLSSLSLSFNEKIDGPLHQTQIQQQLQKKISSSSTQKLNQPNEVITPSLGPIQHQPNQQRMNTEFICGSPPQKQMSSMSMNSSNNCMNVSSNASQFETIKNHEANTANEHQNHSQMMPQKQMQIPKNHSSTHQQSHSFDGNVNKILNGMIEDQNHGSNLNPQSIDNVKAEDTLNKRLKTAKRLNIQIQKLDQEDSNPSSTLNIQAPQKLQAHIVTTTDQSNNLIQQLQNENMISQRGVLKKNSEQSLVKIVQPVDNDIDLNSDRNSIQNMLDQKQGIMQNSRKPQASKSQKQVTKFVALGVKNNNGQFDFHQKIGINDSDDNNQQRKQVLRYHHQQSEGRKQTITQFDDGTLQPINSSSKDMNNSVNNAVLDNMRSFQMNIKRYSTMCINNNLQVNSTNGSGQQIFDEFSTSNVNQYGERGVLEVKVVDSGIGISKDTLSKLFKPFIQADKTIQKNYGGTGLGLCICHELVQIMDGNIEVDSKPGVGTEFKVSIPLEISAEVTCFVEESDFDKEMSEIDLLNYEFCVCNHQSSFGIQQIKKHFLKKQGKIYIKDVHEFLTIGQKSNPLLFNQEKTYKAFIVDYQSVRNNSQNLLQILSNHNDSIKIDSSINSPSLQSISFNQQKTFTLKVPVIVLISPFLDESRVKKSDNIFVLRVPFDARSMKKILIFLKRYYQNFIFSKIAKPQNQISGTSANLALGAQISDDKKLNISISSNGPLHSQSYEYRNQNSQQNNQLQQSFLERPGSQITQQINFINEALFIQNQSIDQISRHLPMRFLIESNRNTELIQRSKRYQRSLSNMSDQNKQGDGSNGVQALFIKNTVVQNNNQIKESVRELSGSTLGPYLNQTKQQMKQQQSARRLPSRIVQDELNQHNKDTLESRRSSQYNKNSNRSQRQKKRATISSNLQETTPTNIDQKCLVVNDDQFSLKITSMLLEITRNEQFKQFSILTASNGQEAVQIYKTTPNIKLIMMDIEMPYLDGYEATKKIREYEDEVKRGIMAFIIGVSGNSTQQHFRKCQQVGMNEAVTIPISNTKIIELVSKLFS